MPPAAAAAPPPVRPAPAPAVTEPKEKPLRGWNVGAGLGYGGSLAYAGALAGVESSPEYRSSLERRLWSRTWLAFNLQFSYDAYEEPISSDSPDAREKLNRRYTSQGALLGLRQVVAKSVVELSLFAGVFAAHASYSGDDLRPGESGYFSNLPGSNRSSLGALFGLAVERELIDDLALRLSLDVASARVSRWKQVQQNGDERTSVKLDERRVDVALGPALQIHFYF